MAIVVFDDVFLPNRVIEAGIRGKQIRRNSRITTVSGAEAVNVVWDATLREYELGTIPMRRVAWQDIEAIHEVTDGGAFGFLLEDPKDSSITNSSLGVVAALGSNQYQLFKRYIVASHWKDRKITRIKLANFVLNVGGVPQTLGTDFTGDITKGIVVIPAAPEASTVTWTGSFYVPVHFLEDSIDWQMIVPGQDPDARFLSGPSVVLQEILE